MPAKVFEFGPAKLSQRQLKCFLLWFQGYLVGRNYYGGGGGYYRSGHYPGYHGGYGYDGGYYPGYYSGYSGLYGRHQYWRKRRSISDSAPMEDQVFDEIARLDADTKCVLKLICEVRSNYDDKIFKLRKDIDEMIRYFKSSSLRGILYALLVDHLRAVG